MGSCWGSHDNSSTLLRVRCGQVWGFEKSVVQSGLQKKQIRSRAEESLEVCNYVLIGNQSVGENREKGMPGFPT